MKRASLLFIAFLFLAGCKTAPAPDLTPIDESLDGIEQALNEQGELIDTAINAKTIEQVKPILEKVKAKQAEAVKQVETAKEEVKTAQEEVKAQGEELEKATEKIEWYRWIFGILIGAVAVLLFISLIRK